MTFLNNYYSLDHIAIAVSDLDASINLYKKLGFASTPIETLTDQNIKLCFVEFTNSKIELISPLNSEGPVAKFLAKRGEGLHHICYQVSDIKAELTRLEKLGIVLIDKEPRAGANNKKIAFLNPKSFNGVLVELCET